jgi:hypothetical protein
MKNSQKGFIALLPLALIALLLIGGGMYLYTQQKQVDPPVTENVALPTASSTQTTTQASSTAQNFAESKKVAPDSQDVFEIIARSNSASEKKNNDAIIQRNLATVQTQAEIYYGGTGTNSYGTAGSSCSAAVFSDTTIVKAIADAQAANGGTALVCNNSMIAYAISSKLSSDTTRYWCVDSTGSASKSTTALEMNTVCPVAK